MTIAKGHLIYKVIIFQIGANRPSPCDLATTSTSLSATRNFTSHHLDARSVPFFEQRCFKFSDLAA
jgi:hypothetical protein